MATESVKILIEAEDKATAKLKAAQTEQEKAAARSEIVRAKAAKQLAIEKTELFEGAEAAHAMALELQGLDAATAALIARDKELVDQQKKLKAEQEKISQQSGAKQTKSGAEFFGAIAGIAGGSEIASIAGQIGGLTEKTSQFGEVAKMGGANAMLFKAGLVAAAGAIGYQIGSALGNVIFQVEKFNRELEDAVVKLEKLDQVQMKNLQNSFSEFKIDLEFAPDQDAAVAEKIAGLKKELKGYESGAREARNAVAELQAQNELSVGSLTTVGMLMNYQDSIDYLETYAGDFKALLAEKQKDLESDTTKAELIREQITELERLIGVEKERDEMRAQKAEEKQSADFLKGIRDEIEMTKAEIAGTANELKAQRGAGGTFDDDEALRLLNQLDAEKKILEAQKKAEQEKEQAAQKEKSRLEQIDQLRKNEEDRLKEQLILLTQGKEAAQAFRLEQQGLGKDEANRIAMAQAELDKIAKESQPQNRQQLQAVESRLLTRGAGGEDPAKKTEEHTKKLAEQAVKQSKLLSDIAAGVNKPQNIVTLKTAG